MLNLIIYIFIYLPTYLYTYLPSYLPIYLSIYLSIYLFIYLFIYLSFKALKSLFQPQSFARVNTRGGHFRYTRKQESSIKL